MMGYTEQKQSDLVRRQLHRMSENSTFVNGGRMYALLHYLVNAQLEGQEKLLNQTALAIDVFKRDKNFDPNSDSIVRVEVGRLRNKLREYYAVAGKDDPVVINIPKGQYVPSIEINNSTQIEHVNKINPASSISANPWWKVHLIPTLFVISIFSGLGFFLLNNHFQGQGLIENTLSNSIRILPFENLSTEVDNAFYSVALREAILNLLQNNNEIKVFSQESLASRVAKQHIQNYLKGSVKIENEYAVVQIQLVQAATDNILWSEQYALEIENFFTIQSDVATNVASVLGLTNHALELSTAEGQPSDYPAAYALYLKAFSPEPSVRQQYLDQALTIDPDFALAHAAKAFLYSRSITNSAFGPAVAASERDSIEQLFRLHADKALALEPGIPLARIAQANFYLYTWRWSQAREIFEQVAASEPTLSHLITYIDLDTYTENYSDAIENLEILIKSNPNFPVFYSLLGGILNAKGDYQAAAEALRIGLNDATVSYSALIERSLLVSSEIYLGNDAVAYQELKLMEELGASNNITLLPTMMFSYSRLNQEDDVLRLYSQFEHMASNGAIIGSGSWVEVYFALGQHEKALTSLSMVAEKVKRNEPDEGFISLMDFLTIVKNDSSLNSDEFLKLRNQYMELRNQIIFN